MSNVPATREMIELSLMEEFHWTPKQISEIPYKKIQQIFLIRNQKVAVENINVSRRQLESEMKSMGTGRGRKFTREV